MPRPAEEIALILQQRPDTVPPPEEESSHTSMAETAETEKDLVPAADDEEFRLQLEAMTVPALRTLARKTAGLGIQGREISKANKELLIHELMKARTGRGEDRISAHPS